MMGSKIPDFSKEQWKFLAVLDAFGTSVHINLAGALAPLLPGPLFEVINKSKDIEWLVRSKEDHFAISKNLPTSVKKKLSKINTPDHLATMVSHIQDLQPATQADPQAMIRLMEKGGLEKEAGKMEIALADKFLKTDKQEQAWHHLKHAADRLKRLLGNDDCKVMYVPAVLKLSNLSFTLGKGLVDLPVYLHKAHDAARQLGDRRSHAIINLHLGRVYYFSDQRADAMVALSVGLNEIEDLADEDILDQSAVFLGLFYFMQGLFKDALPHLERAERLYKIHKKDQLITPMAPILLGYTLTYLGEFHRAIGSLDCNWRMAEERSDFTMATTLRVILGTVLLLIKKEKEADFHLKEALKEAETTRNALALYISGGPMAMKYMKTGQASEAHKILYQNFKEGTSSGLVRQFASPWVMEMICEFEKQGFQHFPGMSFKKIEERAIKENNVHLQGVALRLNAQKKFSENKSFNSVLDDLENSATCLIQSGDIVQLSKTIIEKARLELSRGEKEEGRRQIKKAWMVLGGYADDFFPDDLRPLLDPEQHDSYSPETPQESFERYIDLTETMFPVHGQDEIFSCTVIATNRFFGAERGGLFWFPGGKMTQKPELRASCNLTASDTKADNFKPNHLFIIKAFKENRQILKRSGPNRTDLPDSIGRPVKSILCLPVKIRGKIRAVLYHDNSYLEDCFDFLDDSMLEKMMGHVSRQVARIYEYFQIREERNDLIVEKSLHEESLDKNGLIYQSPVMAELINQIDMAACSNSTILILGETGVGKELMARRVHTSSPRRDNAFVVVDATTISEGLFESELFGHEKGAFTSADRQKKGRLELADKGTLFIDEIGELPKSTQVKFLRAIQERSFFRVGGTRIIHSDFRLIAATNRDLAEEVAAKRFREDLYYRLNVIPFKVPALRDRVEDVSLLATHFLKHYSKNYHRKRLIIDPETDVLLKQYNWPGNVRELENIIERSVLLSSGDSLEVDLPLSVIKKINDPFSDNPTMDELQKKYISYILDETGGKISGAAGILGLKRTTLLARMRKLGMR